MGARLRARLRWMRRRLTLALRYHGVGGTLLRGVTLPGRRLARALGLTPAPLRNERTAAAEWFEFEGRPVSVVIPTHGPTEELEEAIASIRRTTPVEMVQIVVADDASAPEHRARLAELEGIEVVYGEENLGFAGNANRGIAHADPDRDIVLLHPDVIALNLWLVVLQRAAHGAPDVGIVGAKLLYPDGRIQHGGIQRKLEAPEGFDHRFRFQPTFYRPANVTEPRLAVSGSCLYIRREVLDLTGPLDPDQPPPYADVDLCLRAWEAGFRVLYCPAAELYHLESASGGALVPPEPASGARFWGRWTEFLDRRTVRGEGGRLRVVYVLEDTRLGGGARVVFEHCNRLAARGHDVELFALGPAPDWFDLRVAVRSFADYDALIAELSGLEAIKVATWWNTAAPVWQASVLRGIPVYFVQDIESSYYPGNEMIEAHIVASYRPEFHYLTTSGWLREQLAEFGVGASVLAPGIDLELFRPLSISRREDLVLGVGRSNPLKNLPLTLAAFRSLGEPRPELRLFGIEPDLAQDPGVSYEQAPSDERVNELYNEAAVFVQTSSHEGFCLPALEAMATGAAVVCTDAHGNRDYCRDGVNCLMPGATVEGVAGALRRALEDRGLRERLGAEGRRTAADYHWETITDRLEAFYARVADGPTGAPDPPDVSLASF